MLDTCEKNFSMMVFISPVKAPWSDHLKNKKKIKSIGNVLIAFKRLAVLSKRHIFVICFLDYSVPTIRRSPLRHYPLSFSKWVAVHTKRRINRALYRGEAYDMNGSF